METVRQKLFGSHDPYLNLELLDYDGSGWSSTNVVFEHYIREFRPKLIVEVGTWFGGSARTMAKHCQTAEIPNFEIVCIDTFLGSFEHWDGSIETQLKFRNGRPNNYEQFLSNMVHSNWHWNVTPFPIDSTNGYHVLKNLEVVPDLVYIDAGHDYDSVVNDLRNYADLLKPGGILIGDDWFHDPIKKAAQNVFKQGSIIEYGVKFVWIK